MLLLSLPSVTTSKDFLVLLGFLIEVIDGHAESVPHGSAAARIDACQAFFQLFDVAGEFLIQKRVVVEIDDEDFVLRVGLLSPG